MTRVTQTCTCSPFRKKWFLQGAQRIVCPPRVFVPSGAWDVVPSSLRLWHLLRIPALLLRARCAHLVLQVPHRVFPCVCPRLSIIVYFHSPLLFLQFMYSLRLRERHRFSTRPFVIPFNCDCYLRHWAHQFSIRMVRCHADRTEICRTLQCRVHRYLLWFAIMVCLLGHTVVQTYVAEGFLAASFHLDVVFLHETSEGAAWCAVVSDVSVARNCCSQHSPHGRLDVDFQRLAPRIIFDWFMDYLVGLFTSSLTEVSPSQLYCRFFVSLRL